MRYRVSIQRPGQPLEIRLIEAESHFPIYSEVGKEGGTVINIEDAARILQMPQWFKLKIGSGVRHNEVMRLAKNLSAMISAGLSLSRALTVIERQSSNKYLKEVMVGLTDAVKGGSSFHEALAQYPRVFSPLFVAMARAGEESGSLADALLVVGTQMERTDELRRKVKGAMIYPAIVLTAVIIVAVLMLIFVVPTLTKTFTQLGVKVPVATRAIIAISDFMVNHAALFIMLTIAVLTGAYLFVKSARGAALVLAGALHIPIIGEVVRETYSARAARTLSSLLMSGVPLVSALSITEEVVHTGSFAAVINEAGARVKKGEPLSVTFAAHTDVYPLQMSDMLAVGEETGKVAEMLGQIAAYYEQDVAQKTKDLSTIVEPVLMIVIGVFVGIFAVSMIAPIYQLSGAIK